MDQHRLFTNEQLAEVYRCVSETLESAYLITPERQKLLEGVSEQIRWAVPDLPEFGQPVQRKRTGGNVTGGTTGRDDGNVDRVFSCTVQKGR